MDFSTEQLTGNANSQKASTARKASHVARIGTRLVRMYRRHGPGCAAEGSCDTCPIWIDTHFRGSRLRISLKTSDWDTARNIAAETLDQSLDRQFNVSDVRTTIENFSRRVSGPAKAAPSTVGTMAELTVATDLLGRGYEVFRSLSPSCSCDLVARNPQTGAMVRVEVKTADLRSRIGSVRRDKFDVLAVLAIGKGVKYRPEMPQISMAPVDQVAVSAIA